MKKKTTEEFLAELKASGYWNEEECDYSRVEYVDAKTKVLVIHREFGTEHMMNASVLLRGGGLEPKNAVDPTQFVVCQFQKKRNGEGFDYSKVVYRGGREKVIITCKNGHEFEQTPGSHKRGAGCPKCSDVHRPSTEEFLKKLKDSDNWREEYDYSQVEYVNSITRVLVVHREFGTEHMITPKSLLKGSELGAINAVDKTKFAVYDFQKKRNGEGFDYSKVVYRGDREKVIITCKNGHEFEQTMGNHKQGVGCPKCSSVSRPSTEEFQKRLKASGHWNEEECDYSRMEYVGSSKKVLVVHSKFGTEHMIRPHDLLKGCKLELRNAVDPTKFVVCEFQKKRNGEGFDYSKVVYVGANKKVIITCKNGHKFEQEPSEHKKGRGCPKCSGVHRPSTEEFIEQAKLVHGDRYKYDKVKYIGVHKKVTITCRAHGDFEQTPNSHKAGQGCPICNVGFTSDYSLSLIDLLCEEDLLTMSPVELYTIIKQGKLPKQFAALIHSKEDSEGRVRSIAELREKFASGEEIPDDEDLDDILAPTDEVDEEAIDRSERRLPTVASTKALHSLDREIYAGMDQSAIELLMQYKLRQLWNSMLNGEVDVEALKKEQGGKWFTAIQYSFIGEYEESMRIRVEKKYSFPHPPSLMQKLTVYRLLQNKYYGNWSGTGAGKTLSFILASRKLKSRLTLVIAMNSTVDQTCDAIKEVYPNSRCFVDYDENMILDLKHFNYLVLNYEKFQQEGSEKLFRSLTDRYKIGFIVIDEVHNAKQREEDSESKRRAVMMRLIGRARENNPNLHVLAMSATPVINNLQEAKSLLTMMSGLDHEDIQTRQSIGNAFEVFKELTLNGLRYMPKYNIDIRELTGQNMSNLNIDGSHLLNDILKVKKGAVIDIERLLLPEKLKAVAPYLKKGTVVYSYYTDKVIGQAKKFIEAQGFKVGTYTGGEDSDIRDKSLKDFLSGKIDILIGSKPIGTGVDGLQQVCDRLICLTLPWTDSEFTQLKGRIYRQGSVFNTVDIIIPQVKIDMDGDEFWSWDIQRINLIKKKRTLADAAVDGVAPSSVIASPNTLLESSKKSLASWKERIASGEVIVNDRKRVQYDLYPEIDDAQERAERAHSELTEFNRLGRITKSENMHKKFKKDPDSWKRYHALRRESMGSWTEIPYEYIATSITRADDVVVDFGCGENLMRHCIPNNTVHAFDHVAIDDSVTACDMRNTGLESESVDIGVFSLALWGPDSLAYIKEAHRILRKRGCIYIAEPIDAYDEDQRKELMDSIERIGFKKVGDIELRGKFFYLCAMKS